MILTFRRYPILLLILGLTSCTPPPAPPVVASPPVASPPVASPPVASPPVASPPVASPPVASPPVTTQALRGSSVPVNVYHMDDRCEKLVKQLENLPKDKTLETAIGSVLTRANTADFTITDYRVITQGKIATIVLRLPTGARRSFKSMSSCEQMAYFGAMRETMVQRKEWNIQDVKFTDGKKEIQF
jgi:hypothetical protein